MAKAQKPNTKALKRAKLLLFFGLVLGFSLVVFVDSANAQVAAPTPPTITGLPACANGPYSATINWNGAPSTFSEFDFFVDISETSVFDDAVFGTGNIFYTKAICTAGSDNFSTPGCDPGTAVGGGPVGSFSTGAPAGFGLYDTSQWPWPGNGWAAGERLILNPDTRYYVRVFNGSHSSVRSFNVASCPPVSADIRANSSNGPVTITYNNPVTISWSSSGTGSGGSCSVTSYT